MSICLETAFSSPTLLQNKPDQQTQMKISFSDRAICWVQKQSSILVTAAYVAVLQLSKGSRMTKLLFFMPDTPSINVNLSQNCCVAMLTALYEVFAVVFAKS